MKQPASDTATAAAPTPLSADGTPAKTHAEHLTKRSGTGRGHKAIVHKQPGFPGVTIL